MKAIPKNPKRPRTSSAQTVRKIVDATLAIAAKKGFEQTTTAEIARRAGVAEGSIYNYFRTKDDLLVHMVAQYASSFLEQLTAEIGSEHDVLKKIERLISFHIHFFTQEGNIFQVIYGKRPGTKVQMARIVRIAIAPYVGIIEEILREGIAQGKFRKVNPQIAAAFLLGGMQLTLLRHFFDLADYRPEEAVGEIRDVFFEGLMAQSPSAVKQACQ
jgi:TetR/AcrR family fatty acid metabolism transcriptional regulator